MNYKFKYRRHFFWVTLEAIGHKYEESQNKMIVYLKNGGVQEVKDWKNCEIKLGADWFTETKRQMELKVGQSIPTEVKGNDS
jgi:hypothetical protein